MKYFKDCQTAEELKKEYKKMAVKLHPDNGGNEEEFKKMQDEFSKVFDLLKNTHYNSKGERYTKDPEYGSTETAQEFMDIIEKLMFIKDLNVELCGTWIWISGNTKEYKDYLKELGCKWSSNKKMWYYQRDGKRKYHKKAWTIDEIRNTYGTQTFKEDREAIA